MTWTLRDLPRVIQLHIWSYLGIRERRRYPGTAPAPATLVHHLPSPTARWFEHNPDCAAPFHRWLSKRLLADRAVRIDGVAHPIASVMQGIIVRHAGAPVYLFLRGDVRGSAGGNLVVGKKDLSYLVQEYFRLPGVIKLGSPGSNYLDPSVYQYRCTVSCSNVGPAGDLIVTYAYLPRCQVWSIKHQCVRFHLQCESEVCAAHIGAYIYLGGDLGHLLAYDYSGRLRARFLNVVGPGLRVSRILEINGQLLLSSADSQRIVLFSLVDGAPVRYLTGHESWISSMECSRDGRVLVSCDWEGSVRIWDTETYHLLQAEQVPRTVFCCAASHDGATVVCSTRNGGLWLLDRSAAYAPVLLQVCHPAIETVHFTTGRPPTLLCLDVKGFMYIYHPEHWTTPETVQLPIKCIRNVEVLEEDRILLLSGVSSVHTKLYSWQFLEDRG